MRSITCPSGYGKQHLHCFPRAIVCQDNYLYTWRVIKTLSRFINMQKQKNLANIQPSWPYAWSTTCTKCLLSLSKTRVYLGVRTCELFLCFIAIVRVTVSYVGFFVFFVLRHWWVSLVLTPRQSPKLWADHHTALNSSRTKSTGKLILSLRCAIST